MKTLKGIMIITAMLMISKLASAQVVSSTGETVQSIKQEQAAFLKTHPKKVKADEPQINADAQEQANKKAERASMAEALKAAPKKEKAPQKAKSPVKRDSDK